MTVLSMDPKKTQFPRARSAWPAHAYARPCPLHACLPIRAEPC